MYFLSTNRFQGECKIVVITGELGNAAKNKLIMNMMLGTFTASLSESLALAEKAGLDQYILLEILNLSGLSCNVVKNKGEAIMEVSAYHDIVTRVKF